MVLFSHAANCRRLRIKPIRTRVYTPSTNGKAESLIQAAIREWANARLYRTPRSVSATSRLVSISKTGADLTLVSTSVRPYPVHDRMLTTS